jgi:halogenation protein CepH
LVHSYRQRSSEFADAVDEVVANKEQSMLPLFKSAIVKQAMQGGTQVQARALLGDDADAEHPLFEGGLVPSKDGMFWSLPG